MTIRWPQRPSLDASEVDDDLYLDLLKRSLVGWLYQEIDPNFDAKRRLTGSDWPKFAHTMVGWQRLSQLQAAVEDVISRDVPGDFLEAGVWRGGSSILMRGVLKAHNALSRKVWCYDSFAGFPSPDTANFPQDATMYLCNNNDILAVPLQRVQDNFAQYGLLDDLVTFVPGWFKDTMPAATVKELAILRLDSDLYESTYLTLETFYLRLSSGGYCIVDDWHAAPPCRQAVEDYCRAHEIDETIVPIDGDAVYWIKS
jgi:O-methyltransferase